MLTTRILSFLTRLQLPIVSVFSIVLLSLLSTASSVVRFVDAVRCEFGRIQSSNLNAGSPFLIHSKQDGGLHGLGR